MTSQAPRRARSVWTTAQKCAASQRKGRYLPEAMAHPAKMLPAIAAQVIARYSQPGDLVADPMCGIGTTLIEAVHQGRRALGIEYEPRWAELAARGLAYAKAQGAPGIGEVLTGDAREFLYPLALVDGPAALMVTSPPYGTVTHGHIRATRNSGTPGVQKWNHRYSADPANLAHTNLDALLDGFRTILDGCLELLRPGGIAAITVRPIRVQGELIDLPGEVIHTGQKAGFLLEDRIACLLCGLRGDQLVPRASFFQMHEARRQRANGLPVHALAHEDLVLLRRPGTPVRKKSAPAASESFPVQVTRPARRARGRKRKDTAITDPAAELQLGRCLPCGKYRYATRTTAKRAARILHPGHRMNAYNCRKGDCWHIGRSGGKVPDLPPRDSRTRKQSG